MDHPIRRNGRDGIGANRNAGQRGGVTGGGGVEAGGSGAGAPGPGTTVLAQAGRCRCSRLRIRGAASGVGARGALLTARSISGVARRI